MQFGSNLTDIALVVGSIIISMSFHEAMHGFVAHWLGDTTAKDLGRLTLNPLKHIDLYMTVLLPTVLLLLQMPPIFIAKPVPITSNHLKYGDFGMALVALAGPFTNLLLATIVALALRTGLVAESLITPLLIFVQVNIGFFVFNMIPFPPLDGSRLLYALAPEVVQDAMRRIEQLGFVVLIFIFLVLAQPLGHMISFISVRILSFLLGVPIAS